MESKGSKVGYHILGDEAVQGERNVGTETRVGKIGKRGGGDKEWKGSEK